MRSKTSGLKAFVALAALVVVSCATTEGDPSPVAEPAPPSPPSSGVQILAEPARFDDLPGWSAGDHDEARKAFLRSCARLTSSAADAPYTSSWAPSSDDWRAACEDAIRSIETAEPARAFFERRFEPAALYTAEGRDGLATAYFEPELEVRATPSGRFDEPLLSPPPGLRTIDVADPSTGVVERRVVFDGPNGAAAPTPARADLVAAAPRSNVAGWGRVEDVAFLQIQGSGRIRFPDGRSARAAYAGHNGRPYVSIARILIDAGELAPDQASNARIRTWLATEDRAKVTAFLNRNERYIFFKVQPIGDPTEGPVGAASIPLTTDVSVAVDPNYHPYGALYWMGPEGSGAPEPRLAVAQDTGGAIKGPLRVDLFLGSGAEAGARADVVKHAVSWWALLPKPPSPNDRLAAR